MPRIACFTHYEALALAHIFLAVFEPSVIQQIVRNAQLTSLESNPQGYRVMATHPLTGNEQVLTDSPRVLGHYENTTVELVAQIHSGVIRLDCQSTDGTPIPSYFRNRDIRIELG